MATEISERLKQRLTYVVMGLLTIPLLVFLGLPKSANLVDLSLYGALVTGFIGIIILLAQFFLGTRSITGLIYRDLPWTLRIHKNIGIYGTLLIFAHPILLLLPYAENVLYVVKPDFSTSFDTSVTWGRIALYALLAVWITSAIVRGRIKYRPWKYTHYLGYIVLPLAFIHSPPIGRTLTSSHALLIYWYVLAAFYLVLVALRMRHMFGYSKQQYQVVSINQVTEDAWVLRLKVPESLGDGAGLRKIRPGQYVYLQRSLKGEEHPFSVVDYDTHTGELLLAFKTGGTFSNKLIRIQQGASVLVDGPYGTFTQELTADDSLPRVFIAGGIGITPFVRNILAAPTGTEQYVFFCNRTQNAGVFRRQLQQRLGGNYIDVLSQGSALPTDATIHTERGYISDQIVAKYVTNPQGFDYFICGPKPMMDQARRSLLSLGVSAPRIHTEEFSF